MLTRRSFLAAGGAAAALALASRASRSRRPLPTGASSSSSSAARPTASHTSPRPATRRSPASAATSPRTCRAARSSAASSPCIRRWPRPRRSTPRRQALFVHAVASPYRDRSHFDGQNVLETGGTAAYQLQGRLDEPAARPAAAGRSQGDRAVRRPCRWRCAAATRSAPTRLRSCRARRTTCSPASSALYERDPQLHAPVERGDGDADAPATSCGRRRPERRGDRRARSQLLAGATARGSR